MGSERGSIGALSAILSLLVPGLGQLLAGRPWRGLLFIGPILLVLLVAFLVMSGAVGLQALLNPAVVTAALAFSVILGIWRAAAVLDAYRIGLERRGGSHWAVVPWVLVALVVVTQAIPTYSIARMAGTLERISDDGTSDDDRLLGPMPSVSASFEGEGAVEPSPTPSLSPPAGSAPATPMPTLTMSPSPHPTPVVTPSPIATPTPDDEVATLDERVTVLLIGTDNLATRSHRLTDTMLVASLGAEDPRPVMISVPRDTYGAPLPDGRVYNGRLNSLASYARARPDEFPLGGVGTLRETIELLLGIEIDHVASIDMLGLIEVVDAIGGVTVFVTRPIDDPFYRPARGGDRGFQLDAGWQEMDGATALAYARSRLGEGGNDFVRAGRQQRLLAAIRDRVRELGLVSTLPTLLDVIDANVRTDIPRDRLGSFAEAVIDANWTGLRRMVLQPPRTMTAGFTETGAYVLHPDVRAIRAEVARLLPDDAR